MSVAARQTSILVGRHQEVDRLADVLATAIAGIPRVVSIEGDAGIGKTALLRAALGGIDGQASVVQLQGDEFAQAVPFAGLHPWIDPDAGSDAFQVGREILARLDEIAPAILVVDDLHWVDVTSRKAIAIATGRLSHEPVAVVATARPEHTGIDDGWARLRQDADRCERVRLVTLGWPDVVTLAAHHGVALGPEAAQRLTEHTGGNPLYVTTLLEDVPAHILNSPSGVLPVPADLAAVVAAKVASFDNDTAAFLGALSVLGRPTPLPRIGEVAGIDSPSASLARGSLAKMVEQTNVGEPGAASVAFVHPLIRRAVYDSLPPADRRSFHQSAAKFSDHRSALAHRVSAAERTDDALAAELEAESLSARVDQGAAAAARWLRWASEL